MYDDETQLRGRVRLQIAERNGPLGPPEGKLNAERQRSLVSFELGLAGVVALTVVTRLPFVTQTLYAFDSANYALGVRDFDVVHFNDCCGDGGLSLAAKRLKRILRKAEAFRTSGGTTENQGFFPRHPIKKTSKPRLSDRLNHRRCLLALRRSPPT